MSAQAPTRPVLKARYEARQAKVIATAARLFATHGYQATTIADLTEATGLTAGGIYHYIGSKERLLQLVCDELLDPLLERVREIVAEPGPPHEQLRAVLRAWVGHIQEHRYHMLVFSQERHVIERKPQWRRVRRQRKEFEELLESILIAGEEDGAMTFADRRLCLLALLGMVNYSAQWMRAGGRLSAEEIADGYYDLIFGGRGRS
jgi:TetR/AcrR family transcriptional regulator, cholesterol catabolism regulator